MSTISLGINIVAIIMIIAGVHIKLEKKLIYAIMALIWIPALYFTISIQYWYRDHEANFAGVILLSGFMCIYMTLERARAYVLLHKRGEKPEDIAFILRLITIVLTMIGMAVTAFYGARIYVVAFLLFLFITTIPRSVLCNKVIFAVMSASGVIGAVAMCVLTRGAHSGIYEIKNRFGLVVYMLFATVFVYSIYRLRGRVEKSDFSKLAYSAIISTMFTACFDKYIIEFPLCFYFFVYCVLCNSEGDSKYCVFDLKEYVYEVKTCWKNKMTAAICALAPMIVAVFILGPIEIYQANRYAFKFGLGQFVGWYLLISVCLLIAASLLLTVLPSFLHIFMVSLLSAVAVMAYVQYMFLNVKLVSEDGGPLDFSELKTYSQVNMIVWIVALVIFTVLFILIIRKKSAIVRYVTISVTLVQLVAVVALLIGLLGQPGPRYYQFVGDNQYKVASEENLILIVLDTYSREYMNKVVEKYPDALENWHDFTYYDNADSVYHATFPSMPHVLTGYDYNDEDGENAVTKINWLERAWNTQECNEFFEDIHNEGFLFNVHTSDSCDVWGAYNDVEGKIDNIEASGGHVDTFGVLWLLGKMSVYRYVPYVIKPYFEVLTFYFDPLLSYNTIDSQHKDSDIYSSLLEHGLEIGDFPKLIKIEHSDGMHAPFRYSEECTFIPEMNGTLEEAGKGIIVYVDEYLSALKAIGKYDDSTIIIMADHGQMSTDPIFYVKLKGETREKMAINHKEFSYDDMRATIMEIIKNGNGKKYGKPLVD